LCLAAVSFSSCLFPPRPQRTCLTTTPTSSKAQDRRTPLSADHNLLDISSAFHLLNGSPAVASITTTLLAINEILDAGASIGRLIENVASPKS
jgi:hypothetical protein